MSNDVFSFLEFGAIDPSEPSRLTWDFRTGQTAYDWLMGARYLNDIVTYRDIVAQASSGSEADLHQLFSRGVHHPDDAGINLSKLIALKCLRTAKQGDDPPSFFEFGSTLFGCIDGMQACGELLKRLEIGEDELDLGRVKWFGVDNSEYLNKVAELIHPTHSISTELSLSQSFSGTDLFFAKGVSILYQVRSAQELIEMVDCSTLGVFDYSLSYTGERDFYIGSGKPLRYLNVNEVVPMLDNDDTVMMIRRSRSNYEPLLERIIFDGVRGPKTLVDAYIAEDTAVRAHVSRKAEDDGFRSMLWAKETGSADDWVGLQDFCREKGLL